MALSDEQAQAKQAEQFRSDSLWASVHRGDLARVQACLARDSSLLRSRGAVGETLLHAAYLSRHPDAIHVAHWLAEAAPDLIGAAYAGQLFQGETAVHIAIAQHDLVEVRRLLNSDATVLNSDASGVFFNVKDGTYFGGSPLAFAVSFNRGDIVHELVTRGACISSCDSGGNTPVHMAVMHGHIAMYDLLEAMWERGLGRPHAFKSVSLSDLCNQSKLSPIVLAAALGRVDMFNHLWGKSRKTLWQWGHLTAVALPLDHVDSAGAIIHDQVDAEREVAMELNPPASPRKLGGSGMLRTVTHSVLIKSGGTGVQYLKHAPTALEMIVHHDREQLLTSPDMVKLLHLKWYHFGRYVFAFQFTFVLVLLVAFSAAAALRTHMDPSRTFLTCPTGTDASICVGTRACESILLVQTAALMVMDAYRVRRSGLSFLAAKGAGEWNHILSMCLWVSLVISIAVDAGYGPLRSRVPFSVASIAAWACLLWFFLGFRHTGPFVIILHHMVTKDLSRFMFLLIVILLGFTQSFLFLNDYSGTTDAAASEAANAAAPDAGGDTPAAVAGARFGYILRDLFSRFVQPTLNDVSTDRYQLLPSVMFTLLASMLLQALLVGMLDHTLSEVLVKSEHRWQLERARILLCFEADVPIWLRRLPFTQYWQLHEGRPHLHQVRSDDDALRSEERQARVAAAMAAVSTVPRRDFPSSLRLATTSSLEGDVTLQPLEVLRLASPVSAAGVVAVEM